MCFYFWIVPNFCSIQNTGLWQGSTKFPKIYKPLKNCKYLKGDMKQVSCHGPKSSRDHGTKCCHCGLLHTIVCCHQFILYSYPCQCCSIQTGNGSVMQLKVQVLCQFCSSSDKPCQKYIAELWKPYFAALNMMLVSSVASLAIIRLSIQLAQCVASTAFDFMMPFVKVYVQNI